MRITDSVQSAMCNSERLMIIILLVASHSDLLKVPCKEKNIDRSVNGVLAVIIKVVLLHP